MLIYICIFISCNPIIRAFLHKVDRIYIYDGNQLIHYKCPNDQRDMYLFIQTETEFEMIIQNITNKQTQTQYKHYIQYGQCEPQITIIPTSQFTLSQGFIRMNTLNDLISNGHHHTHRLDFVTFFKLEITTNSIIYIELPFILENTHQFDLAIESGQLPIFANQTNPFNDAVSVIKYVFVPSGTYYVIVACGRNLAYLLKVQEEGLAQFIFLPQSTSKENLLINLDETIVNIYYRIIIGSFTACFIDDIFNCQLIEMTNMTNENYIAPSKMRIMSIETEFILVYQQSIIKLLAPYINGFTFIINQEYQQSTLIYLHPHYILQFDLNILNVNNNIVGTHLQYIIKPVIAQQFIITQITVNIQEYYLVDNTPQILLLPAYSQMKIDNNYNITIKRIYGLYQLSEENTFQKLVMQNNCILLLYFLSKDHAQLIDLNYNYKSVNQSDKLFLQILSRHQINYNLFPSGVKHEIIYHTNTQHNSEGQFDNIRSIQLTTKVQYFYLFFFRLTEMIYLNKSSLISPKKQNSLITIQALQYVPVIQYFVVNSIQQGQSYLKSSYNKKLFEGQLITDQFVIIGSTIYQLFFYFDEKDICTYLYDNTPTLIDINNNYCHLIQQNFINFISVNLTTVNLLINVQPLDAIEQVHYPSLEQFDYKLSFEANQILDLTFYDCLCTQSQYILEFDCLLKIKIQSAPINEYIKYRNCYYNNLEVQHLLFQQSIDLCNATNLYSILQVYGSIELSFQTEIKCTSDECYFIITEITQNLEYPLNLTNLDYKFNRQTKINEYIRYQGNILLYSNDSFICTQIPYSFNGILNISTSQFVMHQNQDLYNFGLNKELQAMICVDYGNIIIQDVLRINDQESYCTIFRFNLFEYLYFTIYTLSTFTVQFTYMNHIQIYLNQLNQFTTLSNFSYFFYNPQRQNISFQSNVAFTLFNLEFKVLISTGSIGSLDQGFYQIICPQQISYIYFTAFSQATIMYNNITFHAQGEQSWTISNSLKKKYIIIQLLDLNEQQANFLIRGVSQYLDLNRNTMILELQSDEIITSNGNFSFRGVYVDYLCLPLNKPKLRQLYNYKYTLSGEISESCQLQFIEFQYNNTVQKRLGCLNFNFSFEIVPSSQINIQLRSNDLCIILSKFKALYN